MSDILMMEAANIFIGDHDPEKSKHLKIQNLTLPSIEFTTVEHLGGGAPMAVKWSMNTLNALEPGFKLLGFDEEAYDAAGVGSNEVRVFTARGSIRRKSDGKLFRAVAIIRGSLSKITPDQFERSSGLGHDHGFADVTRYKLEIAGKNWFEVDYWRTKRVRFDRDELVGERRALGLPN